MERNYIAKNGTRQKPTPQKRQRTASRSRSFPAADVGYFPGTEGAAGARS